jgi:hypothetical protein
MHSGCSGGPRQLAGDGQPEVDTLNDALDDRHAEFVEANAAVSNLVEELAAEGASARGCQTWSEHGRTMEPVDLAALATAEASLAALQAQPPKYFTIHAY